MSALHDPNHPRAAPPEPPDLVEQELAAVTALVRALSSLPESSRRKVLATVEGLVPIPALPKRTRKRKPPATP